MLVAGDIVPPEAETLRFPKRVFASGNMMLLKPVKLRSLIFPPILTVSLADRIVNESGCTAAPAPAEKLILNVKSPGMVPKFIVLVPAELVFEAKILGVPA